MTQCKYSFPYSLTRSGRNIQRTPLLKISENFVAVPMPVGNHRKKSILSVHHSFLSNQSTSFSKEEHSIFLVHEIQQVNCNSVTIGWKRKTNQWKFLSVPSMLSIL